MRIKVKRESFARAFQMAAGVAPTRSPKAVLMNVKLAAHPDETVLTATDLEVAIRLSVPDVEVETAGETLIPVQRLNMILRECSDEFISLESDDDKTIIQTSNSRIVLQVPVTDEFPDVSNFEAADYYEVPANVFREMIRRTLFATDAESSRFALSGVLLEFDGDQLFAVGTDGRRLAAMQGKVNKVGSPEKGDAATIVPAKSMQIIERILPEDETPIQLAPRANDLWLQEPNTVFYTRLVEGRYPKWRDVIPDRPDGVRIELPVGPFNSALRQASVVASEESRGVDFKFTKGSLILGTETAEVGQSRVEMPIGYDGDDLTIILDHRFVLDFLKVLPPDKMVTVILENADQAALFQTDDGYSYIVMPLSQDKR